MQREHICKGNDVMHKLPTSFSKGTLRVSQATWEPWKSISPTSALVCIHSCTHQPQGRVPLHFWSPTKMPLSRNLPRNVPGREPTPSQS